MNLAMSVLLAQSLKLERDIGRSITAFNAVVNRFILDGGHVIAYRYANERPPDDFLMSGVVCSAYKRGDIVMSIINAFNLTSPPRFAQPAAIFLFIDYTEATYNDNILSFLPAITGSVHVNLRVVVSLQSSEVVPGKEVILLMEKLQERNIRNVIVLTSVVAVGSSNGTRIYHWTRESILKGRRTTQLGRDILLVNVTEGGRVPELLVPNEVMFPTNFDHQTINVSVAVTPPYVWIKNPHLNLPKAIHTQELFNSNLAGLDILIVDEFRRKYNLTGYYIIHPSEVMELGKIDDDDNSNGVLEETALGISNIAIGGNIASPVLYETLNASLTYFEDSLYWYVPGAQEIPRWMNLYLLFDWKLWVCIGIIYVSTTMALFFTVVIGYPHDSRKDFSTVMLIVLATLTSQAVPSAFTGRPRIIFGAAVLYGMHLSHFYQSILVEGLSERMRTKPITTIAEAVESELDICVSGISYEFFRAQNLSSSPVQNSSIDFHVDYTDCLNRVAFSRDCIALTPEKPTEYSIPLKYLTSERTEMISKMNRPIISYPVSMYVARGWPYVDRLNFVVTGLFETGIIDRWWKDVRRGRKLRMYKSVLLSKEPEYRSISLSHAVGVFPLLLTSLAVSGAVFVAEVAWHRIKNGKREERVVHME